MMDLIPKTEIVSDKEDNTDDNEDAEDVEEAEDAEDAEEDTTDTNDNQNDVESNEDSRSTSTKKLTKSGLPRKRRPAMSKQEKAELADQNHRKKIEKAVGRMISCESTCTFRCIQKIPKDRRVEILNDYMNMSTIEKKIYVLNLCDRSATKDRTESSKRKNYFKYCLQPAKQSHSKVQVCQLFFINTLGYSKTNNKTVYNLLRNTPNNGIPLPRLSGRHEPSNKFRHQTLVIEHIDSYKPKYRGKKTPGSRRFLKPDITLKQMHESFEEKYPDIVISYRLYCSIVKQQKVCFVKYRTSSMGRGNRMENRAENRLDNNSTKTKENSSRQKENSKKSKKDKKKKKVNSKNNNNEEDQCGGTNSETD